MEDKILEIMRKIFKDENVTTDSSQSNCINWDSMHHLDFIVALENEFGVEIEPEEIAEMKNFEIVKKIILNHTTNR